MNTRIFFAFLVLIPWLLSSCTTVNPYYDPYLSHHDVNHFRNTQVAERVKKRGVMRWLRDLMIANAKVPSLQALPELTSYDLKALHTPSADDIQVTWLGHATFLIQMDGVNFLTDPVLSERVSPLPFIGPKRHRPVGITLEQLPPIDYVLISHNHYDHLDIHTIRALGKTVTYIVPLGIEKWFREKQIMANVIEKDWWETAKVTGTNITFVPAQHFSGRLMFDLNKTLWGGWVVERNQRRFYFAGDTGYTKEFQAIGRRMGPMDVSLIPIGAYAPREHLKWLHADPYDAVRIHQDVRSQNSIGMHWGTFRLTTEPMGEPRLLLKKALTDAGIDHERFITMAIGETRRY